MAPNGAVSHNILWRSALYSLLLLVTPSHKKRTKIVSIDSFLCFDNDSQITKSNTSVGPGFSTSRSWWFPIQICIEFSDLIGWEAVRTGEYGLAYGLAYGPANCHSNTRHQICYFRRVIGEISSVRMLSSISSLPYSKSNVRHEETVLVSSMLFQARYCVKKFKILFLRLKVYFRFINVWQASFQTMLKRRSLGLFL